MEQLAEAVALAVRLTLEGHEVVIPDGADEERFTVPEKP